MVALKCSQFLCSSYTPNICIKIILFYFCIILCLDEIRALEWSLRDQYDTANQKLQNVLYPPMKCFKKRQIFHADRSKHVEQSKHWSILFNQYWFPLSDFDTRNRNPEIYDPKAAPFSFVETFAVIIWLIFMIIFYCINIFFIPLMGLLIFKLFWLFGMLLANARTRHTCRGVIIRFQQAKRKNEFYITPEGRKPIQNRFRMPKIFREDSDEDVPETLREPPSSDFSEVNSEDEVYSSAEEMLMKAAYGMQVVKRPKWRPPNAPHVEPDHAAKKFRKRHTIAIVDSGLEADDESETSKKEILKPPTPKHTKTAKRSKSMMK